MLARGCWLVVCWLSRLIHVKSSWHQQLANVGRIFLSDSYVGALADVSRPLATGTRASQHAQQLEQGVNATPLPAGLRSRKALCVC